MEKKETSPREGYLRFSLASVASKTSVTQLATPAISRIDLTQVVSEKKIAKSLLSKATALHKGLGLGSDDIVARAMRLVTHKKNPHLLREEFEDLEEEAVTLKAALPPQDMSHNFMSFQKNARQRLAEIDLALVAERDNEDAKTQIWETLPPTAMQDSPTPTRHRIPFIKLIGAALIDTSLSGLVLFACVLLSASVGRYVEPIVSEVLNSVGLSQWLERYLQIAPFINPVLLSLAVTFAIQLLALALLGGTLGRGFLGMRASLKGVGGFLSSLWIAATETLSFGGLLVAPLFFAFYRRYPLAPWVALEKDPSGSFG